MIVLSRLLSTIPLSSPICAMFLWFVAWWYANLGGKLQLDKCPGSGQSRQDTPGSWSRIRVLPQGTAQKLFDPVQVGSTGSIGRHVANSWYHSKLSHLHPSGRISCFAKQNSFTAEDGGKWTGLRAKRYSAMSTGKNRTRSNCTRMWIDWVQGVSFTGLALIRMYWMMKVSLFSPPSRRRCTLWMTCFPLLFVTNRSINIPLHRTPLLNPG